MALKANATREADPKDQAMATIDKSGTNLALLRNPASFLASAAAGNKLIQPLIDKVVKYVEAHAKLVNMPA